MGGVSAHERQQIPGKAILYYVFNDTFVLLITELTKRFQLHLQFRKYASITGIVLQLQEDLKFQASIIFCQTITDDRFFLRLSGKILGEYGYDSKVCENALNMSYSNLRYTYTVIDS